MASLRRAAESSLGASSVAASLASRRWLAGSILATLVGGGGCGDGAGACPSTADAAAGTQPDGHGDGSGGGRGPGQGGGGSSGPGGTAGRGATGGEGGNAQIPLEELSSRSEGAICAYAVRCGIFPDVETCQGTIYARLQVFADVGSGKVLYDGQAAAACVDWYAQRGCAVSDLETPSPACALVFTGTLPEGSACLANNQCLSDSCNRAACGPDACCAGTCQLPVVVGGDCSRDGQICARGAFCKSDATGTHASCAPRVPSGQVCDSSDVCVAGQFCNIDPLAGTGVCAAAPREGEACPTAFCGSITDTCDLNTSLCAAKRPIGAPCLTDRSCVNYARCAPETSTCVARVRGGGACTTSADCIVGLPCEAGTCVSPQDVPACP